MTTIATWNLHHMRRQMEISEGVPAVIAHVRPDVLVLTEYVDRGKRGTLENALKEVGYIAGAVSPAGAGFPLNGEGGLSGHPMLMVQVE